MKPKPKAGGMKTQILKRSRPAKEIAARYQASVVILEGDAAGMEYPIKKTYAVIGRSKDAAVPLNDPLVSREHAAIEFKEDAFILKDLGSTNGTYMRGVIVGQRKLAHGDKFQMGDTVLQFILQDSGTDRTSEIG
jgi:pSer/pThr/pTyr-binding forkhead associated (FHA) protein